MKSTLKDIQKEMKSGFLNYKSILFYGPDSGLVSQLFDDVSKSICNDLQDTFTVFNFSNDDVLTSEDVFLNEIASVSFMGNRKLIRIKKAGNKITKIIEEALSLFSSKDVFLVISAGELDSKSSLRKLYESAKMKDVLVFPCYLDDRSNKQFIEKFLIDKNIEKVPFEVSQYLCEHLGQNRLETISELEKLTVYLGDKKNIEMNDVLKCIGDSSALEIQDFSYAMLGFDVKKSQIVFDRLMSVGESPVVLIIFLLTSLKKLYSVCVSLEEGQGMDFSLKKNGVFFWQEVSFYKKILPFWNSKKANSALQMCQDLDKKFKQRGALVNLLLSHFILEFCLKGKQNQL